MHPSIHARQTPDKPAYVMAGSGQIVTYRELDERSNRLRAAAPPPRPARRRPHRALLENHPRYFEVCWAAQRVRPRTTPRSARACTAGEASYIVDDCGAKVFITSAALADMAAELARPTPGGAAARSCVDGTRRGLRVLRGRQRPASRPRRIADESGGGDMLYSSGTTGRPKGVKRPLADDRHRRAEPAARAVHRADLYGVRPDTVYLSPAPLYHAAPLRFCMAVQRLGGTCVVMEHFDAERGRCA